MLKAKDIMTTKVKTVSLDTSVKELANIFTKHNISGAPVLDEDGKLAGIVTESDLITKLHLFDEEKKLHIPTVVMLFESVIYLESLERLEEDIKKLAGAKVRDIYTKNIITIERDTPISEIAHLMSRKKKHLLPVMANNKVVGIIGKADLVRVLTIKEEGKKEAKKEKKTEEKEGRRKYE